MQIRPSQETDAHSITCIYIHTWQGTYLGLVPFGYLYSMSLGRLEQGFISELESKKVISYVAEDAGEVVGFVSGGYERQGDYVYNGEIYALYVLKNYQRQGVGTKLVSTLAKQLNQFSIYSMLVRVLEHNPYRRFYEKVNGIYLRKHHMPFAGELLNVAAYGWIDSSLTYH